MYCIYSVINLHGILFIISIFFKINFQVFPTLNHLNLGKYICNVQLLFIRYTIGLVLHWYWMVILVLHDIVF